MPRLKVAPLTAVTDELLGMRWDNENAVRMYLRRRKTNLARLGLEVREASGGQVCVRPSGKPPVPAPADFEAFAEAVDIALEDAQEDPITDDRARELLAAGLKPSEAVEVIITERARALAAAASVPDVVKATSADRAAAPDKDSPPRVAQPAPALGFFSIRLGGPEFDLEAATLWAGQAAAKLNLPAYVIDQAGRAVREFKPKNGARAAPHARAKTTGPGAPKKDHWPKIEALLQRKQGASVDEVKKVLGWKTAPGLWFFRKWAEEHGRAGDLVDHGQVEGVRTFSLRKPGERR